jgi:hypothetical protein
MKMEADTDLLKGKVVDDVKTNEMTDEVTIIFEDGTSLKIDVEGRENGSHGVSVEYKIFKPGKKK